MYTVMYCNNPSHPTWDYLHKYKTGSFVDAVRSYEAHKHHYKYVKVVDDLETLAEYKKYAEGAEEDNRLFE